MVGLAGTASSQRPADPGDAPAILVPKISSGSVTLPYGELRALWEAAQPKPVAPAPAKVSAPVPYSVQTARYTVQLDAELRQANAQAAFEVLNFADGWMAVPLLPTGEARLMSVEPEGALVTVRDGFYTLLLDAPGHRAVTLHFSADLPDGNVPQQTRVLRLTGLAALINELNVTGIPDGWIAEAPGATHTASPTSNTNNNTSAIFHLAAGLPLSLNLLSDQVSKPAPPALPVPSVWQVEVQSVVRYEEGQLNYKTRLRASTDAGTGLTMALSLPAAVSILSVTGTDLDHWHTVKAESGEVRRLEITWKTPDILRRELLLDYETLQASPEDEWRLVSPQVISTGGRLQSAFYALPSMEGMELTTGETGMVMPAADARQLPNWMAKEIGGSNFAVASSVQPAPADNAALMVRARRLPLLHTAQTTIDESRFKTRLVTDGALLSEGELTVRHEGPSTLTLSLPEGAQLLTCTIDGSNTLPIDRGEGRIELALLAGTTNKPDQVRFSYTSRQKPLAPVSGQIALSLPQTDLFVQSLDWDLQIPDAYEVTALEGNVEVVTAAANSSTVVSGIHLKKELLKAERPTAELFYQKRAVTP